MVFIMRHKTSDSSFQFSVFSFQSQDSHLTSLITRHLLLVTILCLVSCVFLYLSTYAECYMLSVGHFPPSRNGHTFLLITDLSGLGPAVEINFYDEVGRAAPTIRKLLPPDGKMQIDVESYIQTAGTIVLKSSSEQIVGEYWQIQEDGATFMLPLQSPVEGGRYFINCLRFPSCHSNLLVLSDPYGSEPVVQMEFYDKSGELIKVAPKMLQSYGTSAFKVNDYAPWDVLGKVSIRSFRGFFLLHYRQFCDVVLAVPARSPAREFLVDRFSIGRRIESNLVITDVSAEGPSVKIRFLIDNIVVSEVEKLLPPNGTVPIDLSDYIDPSDYAGDVASGIIQISSEAEIIADYWEKSPQATIDTPAIDSAGSFLFISYLSPYDGAENLLSLLNVGQEPVEAEICLYSDEGSKLGDEKLVLKPYNQVDTPLSYYFNGSDSGTVIVKGANLVATSRILDLKSNRHLGKVHAQVIR